MRVGSRPFIVLAYVLWASYLLLLISADFNEYVAPLPVYPEIVAWRFFGWIVVVHIPVMVGLTTILLFLKAIRDPSER